MRHGERESTDSNSGLRKDDQGQDRGEQFIIEAIKTSTSDRPYDRIYYAPTRIAKETCETFVRHDTVVIASSMVLEERADLHIQGAGWEAVLRHLPNSKQTFAALRGAESKAVTGGSVLDGFLKSEGARLFGTILNIVGELEEDSMALCVMHSPLIEAAMLHVWETTTHLPFRAQRPLDQLQFLDFLDHFILLFHGDSCRFALRKSYAERIQTKRERDTLALQVANRGGPRVGR